MNDELEIDNYIKGIIEESFGNFRGINLDEEKNEIFELIKEFVKRNKYFDKSYVC